jgi:hypothetical protein
MENKNASARRFFALLAMLAFAVSSNAAAQKNIRGSAEGPTKAKGYRPQ